MRTPLLVAGLAAFALAPAAPAATVAQTDFLNFTYPFGDENVTVTNGEFTRDDPNNRLFFAVQQIARGDIGLDGSQDAVVVTGANTGGSGFFTDGLVYVDGEGGPELLTTLGLGDRATGGVYEVGIRGGRVVAERFSERGSGACCPTQIDTTVFTRSGDRLVRVGKTTSRAYVFAGFGTVRTPARLRFLPGTSVGTAEGNGFSPEAVALTARAGQRLTLIVRPYRGTATAAPAGVQLRSGSRTLARLARGERRTIRLPKTGTYLLRFTTSARNETAGSASVAADVALR